MLLVGLAGLEPATFRPPDGRATRLRYSPTIRRVLLFFAAVASVNRPQLAIFFQECPHLVHDRAEVRLLGWCDRCLCNMGA